MMSSTRGILIVLSRRGVHGTQNPLNRNAHKLAVHRFSSTSSSSNNASWASKFISGLENYRRSLKWVPIPLSVGFAYICYQQYGHIKERERRKAFGTYKPQDYLASERQQPMFHLHSATCKRQLDCNEPDFESLTIRYIIQQGNALSPVPAVFNVESDSPVVVK